METHTSSWIKKLPRRIAFVKNECLLEYTEDTPDSPLITKEIHSTIEIKIFWNLRNSLAYKSFHIKNVYLEMTIHKPWWFLFKLFIYCQVFLMKRKLEKEGDNYRVQHLLSISTFRSNWTEFLLEWPLDLSGNVLIRVVLRTVYGL